MERIFVASPTLGAREREYVNEALDSTWISSHGRFIDAFEREFADFCEVKHAIATNNGTTALHLALVGLGIGPGDEVILPTVTYIATANAVTYCGATPVLVDVLPGTLNIDPEAVRAAITDRTRAVIPVHLYGEPADMAAITEIAFAHGLYVVEDAAEAHGARFDDLPVGSFGHAGMFSFFGNKIITTGEGGMVVTNDDEYAARLRLYRGQGMDPTRRYWFPVVGYNYRMTNVQAAIGLGQFERLPEALARRSKIAARYDEVLASLSEYLERPPVNTRNRRVDWLYNVFLRRGGEEERGNMMRALDASGIETRPVFIPLHQMPPYATDAPFPVAEDWAARGLSLPLHEGLSDDDIDRIGKSLELALLDR